jgi:hypothetical protein
MAKQWKCARCSTLNDEGTLSCSNCRMIRGAVVPEGSPSWQPTSDPVDADGAAPVLPSDTPSAPGLPSWVQAGSGYGVAPPPKPLWRRIPPGLLIFAVLIAIGAVGGWYFNASRSSEGAITKEGDLKAIDLRVGDCFDLKDPAAEEIGDVTARPCTTEHEYEVFFVGNMPEGDFPPSEAFVAYVTDNCQPAFDTFVGKVYADSELDIFWFEPLSAGWSDGDRSVQCAVYHPRIHRLTESLKGSQQ